MANITEYTLDQCSIEEGLRRLNLASGSNLVIIGGGSFGKVPDDDYTTNERMLSKAQIKEMNDYIVTPSLEINEDDGLND